MPSNLFRRGGTWYARFAVNGQLQRISLRTSDLREARTRLKGLRQKAEREAFGVRGGKPWEDAVSAYIVGVIDTGSIKPATAKRYLVSIKQVHPWFYGHKLAAIGQPEITRYIRDRQSAGATNATIRRDLTAISRVLAYARSLQMISANPAEDVDRSLLRERRAAISIPNADSIAAGVIACETAGLPELGYLIRFLRATGLRSGEAVRARWRDLNGNHLTILETKSGRARTIDVPPDVLPARAGERLFPALPSDTGKLASRWQWIKRSLPLEGHFRLHDLRHAYAVAEIQAGRDIYDLSHHLGHSSVKVTEIYLGYVAGGRSKSRR